MYKRQGYLRFDQKLTKDVELMTGLRIENTNLAYTGRTYDADEDLTSKTFRMLSKQRMMSQWH